MNQRHIRPYTAACSLLVALAASACSSSEEAPPAQTAGTSGTGPSDLETVGRMLDAPKTCTEPNTVCVKLQVPSDMAGPTDSVHFVIYDSPEPPSHPPNGYAGTFPGVQLQAGAVQQFELTNGGLQGEYWLYTVIYMPGGGLFGLPVAGVDYVVDEDPVPLPLDGSAINVATPIHMAPR